MRQGKDTSSSFSRRSHFKLGEGLLFRSWWIFLFLIFSYSFYTHAMQKKDAEYSSLLTRLHGLEEEKELVLQEREDYLLQISSQSDPAWIEMTLMKGLGLVPEGQQKVYFKPD